MITGAIWEKKFWAISFGACFFGRHSKFFCIFHTAYVLSLIMGLMDAEKLMWLALIAYLPTLVAQFLIKF